MADSIFQDDKAVSVESLQASLKMLPTELRDGSLLVRHAESVDGGENRSRVWDAAKKGALGSREHIELEIQLRTSVLIAQHAFSPKVEDCESSYCQQLSS